MMGWVQRNSFLIYAFGMEWDGAWKQSEFSNPLNRMKYNGKENITEMALGLLDYGARNYDPVIGRFMSVDPLASKMPSWSPYSYTFNNPIRYIDRDGRKPEDIIIIGSKAYQKQVMTALINLSASSNAGFELVRNAISSDRDLVIFDASSDAMSNGVNNYSDNYSTLSFDLGQANADLDAANGANGSSLSQTTESSLAHELAHFENGLGQSAGSVLIDNNGYSTGIPADEPHAVEMENRVRGDFGLTQRTHYGGINVGGKEAVQKGSSPLGFGLQDHNRTYTNGNSNDAYQYIFGNIGSSSESRRNYLIGGRSIDRYLKSGASTQQIRLYDENK